MTVKDKTTEHAKYLTCTWYWTVRLTRARHVYNIANTVVVENKRTMRFSYRRVWVGEEHRKSGTLMYQGGWPGCLHTEASQTCREVVSPTSRWNIHGYQQPPHLQQTPWAVKSKKLHLYGTSRQVVITSISFNGNWLCQQQKCYIRKWEENAFTCCLSFLLISCSLHNLQGLHQHSFWQVGGIAEYTNKQNHQYWKYFCRCHIKTPFNNVTEYNNLGKKIKRKTLVSYLFLPRYEVPIIHKPWFQFFWDFHFNLHSIDKGFLLSK